MKNAHLYMFKDVSGIEKLTGMLVMKETFVNKSFINKGFIIITLSGDLKKRKEVSWESMQKYLIANQEFSLNDFTKEYQYEIDLIYQYRETYQIILSWLEVCQVATLLRMEPEKNDAIIEQILKELEGFNDFASQMM